MNSTRTKSTEPHSDAFYFNEGPTDPIKSNSEILDDCFFEDSIEFLPFDELAFPEFETIGDALFHRQGRRFSIEFSRRLDLLSSTFNEEPVPRFSRRLSLLSSTFNEEPVPKRRRSDAQMLDSTFPSPTIAPITSELSEVSNEIGPPAIILSHLRPEDLELHLEETRSRLIESMKRSAESRRSVNEQAVELSNVHQREQLFSSSGSSTLIQQSKLQIKSFFNHASSMTF